MTQQSSKKLQPLTSVPDVALDEIRVARYTDVVHFQGRLVADADLFDGVVRPEDRVYDGEQIEVGRFSAFALNFHGDDMIEAADSFTQDVYEFAEYVRGQPLGSDGDTLAEGLVVGGNLLYVEQVQIDPIYQGRGVGSGAVISIIRRLGLFATASFVGTHAYCVDGRGHKIPKDKWIPREKILERAERLGFKPFGNGDYWWVDHYYTNEVFDRLASNCLEGL